MHHFKKFFCLSFLLLSFLISGCRVGKVSLPENVVESIDKRVQNGINPSIAIGIIDKNGSRYYNYGLLKKNGEEVDEHSIYEIGSITKVFTATLLAQQVLEGSVSLDDPINQYLPTEISIPIKGEDSISLGSLADHTSGLPRMPANMIPSNPNNPFADYSVEQMYTFLSTYTPTREVGSAYEYSNFAQGLLGHILSLNADRSYESLMIQNITAPLDMEETSITLDQEMKNNLAVGHLNGVEVENWDIPTLAGAGAIRSSSSDMLKFLSANLGYSGTDLQAALEMTHNDRHAKAGEMRMGLGWHIKKGVDGDVIWHNGGTGGYRAFAGFVKETGKGVVVLTNSTISIDDIGFHLLDSSSALKDVKTKADAVQLPEETLEIYVGDYELQPGFILTITREGTQLYGQATGQDKIELYAKKEHEFYLQVVEAEIKFNVTNGKSESLTLLQNGQKVTGRRMNDTSNRQE